MIAGFVISVIFTRVIGNRIRDQARRAMEQKDSDALPGGSTRPSSTERDGEGSCCAVLTAGHNSASFTLTRYGGLFEDGSDAVVDRLDALLEGA